MVAVVNKNESRLPNRSEPDTARLYPSPSRSNLSLLSKLLEYHTRYGIGPLLAGLDENKQSPT